MSRRINKERADRIRAGLAGVLDPRVLRVISPDETSAIYIDFDENESGGDLVQAHVYSDGSETPHLAISMLRVGQNHRHRGRGTKVIEALERTARADGARESWVEAPITQSRGFWEKRGYRPSKRFGIYRKDL